MTQFTALEKAGTTLLRKGIGSMLRNGSWSTLDRVANRYAQQGGVGGRLARLATPVAKTMTGPVGSTLGAYGFLGTMSDAFLGTDLPGTSLALNIGMPVVGAMTTSSNLIKARRAGSDEGKMAIKSDIETGANRAAQDFLSGLHIDPNVTNNVDAYRKFSEQIGRGMKGADTYTNSGYKPLTGVGKLQALIGNSNDLIQNQARMQVQNILPSMMKESSLRSLYTAGSKLVSKANTGINALVAGGATIGLASAVLGKKPHDSEAMENEGYAAAQAAIQNRLKGMSSIERMAVRLDPTLAANGIASKFPKAMKDWESQYGPLKRNTLARVVNNFQTGEGTRFYSTDAGGNKNFIN